MKGTRIPVSVLVGSIADGDTVEELLRAYPALTREDIAAALHYAAEAVREAPLVPFASSHMPPQVTVDEDRPDAVASLLTAAGYPATTVRAHGWSGLQDAPLGARLQAEGRWLVTADTGFGDIRTEVPGTSVGVMLLRAAIESRRRDLAWAEATVRSVRLEDLAGCLVVVTPRGIRIRRHP